MSKNIDACQTLFKRHFSRSTNSDVVIGIQVADEKHIYTSNSKHTSTTPFGLGSISKTLISTYAATLINRGTLHLEDSIDKYLSLPSRKKGYPTILQLLTHTSGYHAFIPLMPSIWILITKGFNKKNIYQGLNEQWLTKSIRRIRPLKRKKYRYSDYNYAVLARIIETMEKRPYKDIMLDYLQHTIGMKHTTYGTLTETSSDPYSWIWEDDNPFLASGGAFSTVEDMLVFLQYQINHTDFLQSSHAKHHRTNLNKNVFTGFSWNSFYNGHFYWHIGGQGRYRSYALFDTKKKISIVILATVDINIQHVNRLGSTLYRNTKRNPSLLLEFLDEYEVFQKTV